MNARKSPAVLALLTASLLTAFGASPSPHIGVGAKPEKGAEVLFDGSKEMLHSKWTYWKGPGFKSSLPVKWPIVEDPVDRGTVMMTDDRAGDGGKFGTSDLVTIQEFRDCRVHVEFRVAKPNGNSGVYLQNRYEIQVLDGDKTPHGMAAVINETPSPYHAYNGTGKWNAYDITFRAARFKDGKLVYDKHVLAPLGAYWESLNPLNSWGGNGVKLVDTQHFSRGVGKPEWKRVT